LEYLKTDADRKKLSAQDMKDKITRLQEANVEGALNLTQEARDKSMDAKRKVEMVQMDGGTLANSEIQRRATETLMNNSRVPFKATQEQNQQTLEDIVTQIASLEAKIPGLNKQVY
jgi:laminin beta 1